MNANNWQSNPDSIKTDKVQRWFNGSMIGMIDAKIAKELVKTGKAFVITDQAIGYIINGKRAS